MSPSITAFLPPSPPAAPLQQQPGARPEGSASSFQAVFHEQASLPANSSIQSAASVGSQHSTGSKTHEGKPTNQASSQRSHSAGQAKKTAPDTPSSDDATTANSPQQLLLALDMAAGNLPQHHHEPNPLSKSQSARQSETQLPARKPHPHTVISDTGGQPHYGAGLAGNRSIHSDSGSLADGPGRQFSFVQPATSATYTAQTIKPTETAGTRALSGTDNAKTGNAARTGTWAHTGNAARLVQTAQAALAHHDNGPSAMPESPRSAIESGWNDNESISTIGSPVVPHPIAAAGSAGQAAPASPMQGVILTPLHQASWGHELGTQLVSLARQPDDGSHMATLRLDPPELGPLRITLNISDSVAHAVFSSAHGIVRQTIENALPQLTQQLSQSGITLADANVNDQTGNQQHTHSQQHKPAPPILATRSETASLPDSQPAPAGSSHPERHPDAIISTYA